MPLEITSAGLQIQTREEILQQILARLQAVFGNSLNTSISSVSGQFANIMAELRAVDQQALQDVWRSLDPNGAQGTALDRVSSITGTIRHGESHSTVQGLISFSGAGTVNDGTLIQEDGLQTQWESINGPYSDTGGPYPELVAATFQAVDAGSINAIFNSTWSVVSIVPGFGGFTNPVNDAVPGSLVESDPNLRVRRTLEVYGAGQGPLGTIAAIVSKVNTANGRVDTVRVYHNPAINPVDGDGIPFKAFNVVLECTPSPPPVGLQQDIFNAILTATGAGGQAYGTDYTGTALDIEGQPQAIGFDLVGITDVYMAIAIITAVGSGGDGPVVPSSALDMATLIRTSVVTAADTQFSIIGRDYKVLDYLGIVQNLIVAGQLKGIDGVTLQISDVANVGPYTANFIPTSIRERINLDNSGVRITIDGAVIFP